MKQTFEIPDGCNRVTIELQGNKIVTTFEDEPEFKEGDIIYVTCSKIFIVKDFEKGSFHAFLDTNYDDIVLNDFLSPKFGGFKCRIASLDEINKIKQSLYKVGKIWNAEKKCIEDIEDIEPKRWRAKYNERCWIITDTFSVIDQYDIYCGINDIRYEIGNYFKTKEQAEEAVEKMKELLKQINP